MRNECIMDAIGYLDADILSMHLTLKEKYRQKSKKRMINNILRWSAIAASFIFVVIISMHFININSFEDPGITINTELPSSEMSSAQLDASRGVFVNGKRYKAETQLSRNATDQNVGNAVGFVSLGNGTLSDICVFEYIPDDGKTNKIIVPFEGAFYVYSFHSYINDGTDDWPVKLFDKVTCVEIRDPGYGVKNETVYAKLTDFDALTAFLTDLKNSNRKYDQKELSQYYFEMFKDKFADGQIWISENGNIANGGDVAVAMKLSELINGQNRHIIIIFDDHTELLYDYLEGAGVIVCDNFGYILSEEQVEEINNLIGLN